MQPKIKNLSSQSELSTRAELLALFKECPIPESELLTHLALFLKRQDLTKLLFMDELYRQILDVQGVVMEFGTRWGRHLAIFQNLRGLYEPYNNARKVIGFDSFEGFIEVDSKDGKDQLVEVGAYSTTKDYEVWLEKVLSCHERESPISHMKKFEIVKGDASETVHAYLERNPHTLVALAYFDMDLYKPTKECLLALKNHLTRGSVIGFDELAVDNFPGEGLALKEAFGYTTYAIRHSRLGSVQSYLVIT